MAGENLHIPLDEAYWWLNFSCAHYLRPPLRVWLARLTEAETADDRLAAEFICQQWIDQKFNYLPNPIQERVVQLQNAIKIWIPKEIEDAHKRFNECGGSYLRNPIYTYVMNLREAVEQDPGAAWGLLDHLYNTRNTISDDLEAGETLVECGYAAYKLQNKERAIKLFEEANRRYCSRAHQIAVVYCMIGRLYWELNQHNKTLVAWRKSLARFQKLASHRITATEADSKWYTEVLKRLEASLEYLGGNVPSQAQDFQQPVEQVTPPPIDNSYSTSMGDRIEALPVLAEVPAGPWKQTPGDPNIIGQVEIGLVLIDEQPHYVKNLRGGGHIISLSSIEKHVVVKISGNSMNDAQPTPIEDGDYVLLRRQNNAQAGDIVVAKILDEGTQGSMTTIKRFLVDGNPLLKAESTDPKYGKLDGEFQIDGVAVAVFKPAKPVQKPGARPS